MVTAFESSFPPSSAWLPPRFRFETRILFDVDMVQYVVSQERRGFPPFLLGPFLPWSLSDMPIPSPPSPKPSGFFCLLFLSLSAFPRRKVTGTRPKGTLDGQKVETTISIPPTHHQNRTRPFNDRPSSSYRSSGWSGQRTSLAKTGAVPRPSGRPCEFPSDNDNRRAS
jgi:hypothetical protein